MVSIPPEIALQCLNAQMSRPICATVTYQHFWDFTQSTYNLPTLNGACTYNEKQAPRSLISSVFAII